MTEESNQTEFERYLQFDLGDESYAMRLLHVREVIPKPETTILPNSPDYFLGIMNLRGQIISIVDLRKRLKVASKKEGLEEAVVIATFQGVSIGLVVDSINRVLNFSKSDVSEVPEIQTQVNAKYVQGVYQVDGKLTLLLDLEQILDIEKIKNQLKKAG